MRFLLLFLSLINVFGQQRSTIYQTLTTDWVQNNVLIGPVINIGQIGHRFTFSFSDNNINVCSTILNTNGPGGGAPDFFVVQSNAPITAITDGIKLPFNVENVTSSAGSSIKFTKTIVTNALAPFIYVYTTNINYTRCKLNVAYGGSINPINYTDPSLRSGAFSAGDPNTNIQTVGCAVLSGVDTYCIGDPTSSGYNKIRIYRIEVLGSLSPISTPGRIAMIVKFNDGVTNSDSRFYDYGTGMTVFESTSVLNSLYLSNVGQRIYFTQTSGSPLVVQIYYRGE